MELAGEALALHAQACQGAVSINEVEGDPGFLVWRIHGAGEEVGFEEGDAFETPGDVAQFLDQQVFGRGLGFVLVAE